MNMKHKVMSLVLPLLTVTMLGVGIGTSAHEVFSPQVVHADSLTGNTSSSPLKNAADKSSDSSDSDSSDSSDSSDATSSDSSSKYGYLQVPSRLTTAYHDAYQDAQAESQSPSDSKKQSKYKILQQNINTILNTQNSAGNVGFSNVGALYGSLGLSTASGTSNITQTMKADKTQITKNLGVHGVQYWKFGLAYSNLVDNANAASPSSLGANNVVSGFTGISSMVANFGISLLKAFSPAPVILALNDSDILNSASYRDNLLVAVINDNDPIKGFVQMFGSQVPGLNISIAMMIMLSIIMLTTGLALLSVFMNGRQFGMSVRKTAVKVLVVCAAIPLAAKLYDVGLNTADGVVKGSSSDAKNYTLSTNLDLADWAQGARFALPAGMSLKVEDNNFVLGQNDIKAINLFSAEKAGVISASDYNNGNPTQAVQDKVSAHILASAKSSNKTRISWDDPKRVDSGDPWYTDVLNNITETVGSNKLLDTTKTGDENENPASAGYLAYAGLYSNNDGTEFTMSQSTSASNQNAIDYGLTPIAAFNMMNTSFDASGFSVNTNLENPTIPTIAIGADGYTGASLKKGDDLTADKPPLLVSGILSIVMFVAAITALMRIITAGLGGVFGGGGTAAFGSAAGAGQLFGGILALIGGVVGLSMIIVMVQGVVNSIWGFVYGNVIKMLDKIPVIGSSLTGGGPFLKTIKKIPWIGDMIAHWFVNGLVTLILVVVALIVLPKLVKIPIEAFGTWVASLPSMLAEKAQAMENRFTGDYRSGGRSGGHISAAAKNASAKAAAQAGAMKAGGLMLAGAAMKSVVSKNNNSSVAGDNNSSSDVKKAEDKSMIPDGAVDEKSDKDSQSVTDAQSDNTASDEKDSDATNGMETHATDENSVEAANGDEAANAAENLSGDEAPVSADDISAAEDAAAVGEDAASMAESAGDATQGIPDAVTGETPESVGEGTNVAEQNNGDDNRAAVDSNESVTGGDTNESTEESVAGDEVTEATDAPDVDASETPSVAGDAVSAGEAAAATAEAEKAMNQQSVMNGANIQDSKEGDSVTGDNNTTAEQKAVNNSRSENRAGNIENSDKSQSVTDEGSSAQSVAVEGDKSVSNAMSDAKASTLATADNSSISADKQTGGATSVDNSARASSMNASADRTTTQKSTGGDVTGVTNTASVVTPNPSTDRAQNGAGSRRETQAGGTRQGSPVGRGTSFAQSLKSGATTVGKTVLGANDGVVSAKEQAAMGAAHMVAGAVGAQNLTQNGVNNINARKGMAPKATPNASNNRNATPNGGVNPNMREAQIQQMERDDALARKRRDTTPQANGPKPSSVKPKAKSATQRKTSEDSAQNFFQSIRPQKK